MENRNNSLIQAAMFYGLPLGMYWIFKYFFFMYGISYQYLMPVYWGLSLLVPVFAYNLTKRYRSDLGGTISFFMAWQFGVFIYFFAALLVSVVHYLFYRFVAPPDYIQSSIDQTVEMLKQVDVDPQIIQTIMSADFSPIQLALQGILNNVFYGMIFSIPVAALLCGKKRIGSSR